MSEKILVIHPDDEILKSWGNPGKWFKKSWGNRGFG
jgi:hypothetical protein